MQARRQTKPETVLPIQFIYEFFTSMEQPYDNECPNYKTNLPFAQQNNCS